MLELKKLKEFEVEDSKLVIQVVKELLETITTFFLRDKQFIETYIKFLRYFNQRFTFDELKKINETYILSTYIDKVLNIKIGELVSKYRESITSYYPISGYVGFSKSYVLEFTKFRIMPYFTITIGAMDIEDFSELMKIGIEKIITEPSKFKMILLTLLTFLSD